MVLFSCYLMHFCHVVNIEINWYTFHVRKANKAAMCKMCKNVSLGTCCPHGAINVGCSPAVWTSIWLNFFFFRLRNIISTIKSLAWSSAKILIGNNIDLCHITISVCLLLFYTTIRVYQIQLFGMLYYTYPEMFPSLLQKKLFH